MLDVISNDVYIGCVGTQKEHLGTHMARKIRKFEDGIHSTEVKVELPIALYEDGVIRKYTACYNENSSSSLGSTSLVTWTGVDGVERLIAETAYSCNATAASFVDYRWEFCLQGVDEYDACTGQTWGRSLMEANPICWDFYTNILQLNV
jgi:hypothetical protein